MEKLTKENKINLLETTISQLLYDHPEYQEENTTGWDLIEGLKLFLDEEKA